MTRGADRGRGPGAGSCGRLQRDFSLCGRALGRGRFADGERRRSCREQVRGDTGRGWVAERQQEMEAEIRDGETNQELRPWRYDDAPADRFMPSARARRIEASGGLAERGLSQKLDVLTMPGPGRGRSLELGEQPRNWRGRRANKQAPELASRGAHMVRKRGAVSSPLYRRHRP